MFAILVQRVSTKERVPWRLMGMSKYSVGQIEIHVSEFALRLSGLIRMKTKGNRDHLVQLSTHLWAHGRFEEVLSIPTTIIKADGDIS